MSHAEVNFYGGNKTYKEKTFGNQLIMLGGQSLYIEVNFSIDKTCGLLQVLLKIRFG